MRILPIMHSNRSFVNSSHNAHKKLDNSQTNHQTQYRGAHKYTGVASRDLAYASMFDSAIAQDLKLMGLI